MLLQQQSSAAEADDGDDGVKRLPSNATSSSATVLRFISAVFNTKPLAKPKYIVLTATSKQPATELWRCKAVSAASGELEGQESGRIYSTPYREIEY